MSQILPVATSRQTRAWLWAELRGRPGEVIGTLLVGILAAAAAILPVYALGVLVDRVRAGAGASAIVEISIVIGVAAVVGGAAIGLSTYLIG
nr:hypothetical protein GCM10020092_091550 [Actinoplanes digitatis]